MGGLIGMATAEKNGLQNRIYVPCNYFQYTLSNKGYLKIAKVKDYTNLTILLYVEHVYHSNYAVRILSVLKSTFQTSTLPVRFIDLVSVGTDANKYLIGYYDENTGDIYLYMEPAVKYAYQVLGYNGQGEIYPFSTSHLMASLDVSGMKVIETT